MERGVRFVQLYPAGGHLDDTWDAHTNIEANLSRHAAEVDQPIAALLTDLQQRACSTRPWSSGAASSAGCRSAKVRAKKDAITTPTASPSGWPAAVSKGGITYGETDDFGFEAVVNKVHLHDIHATILHLLGLNHEMLTYFHEGRDQRLTDVAGQVVRDIIA